MVGSVLVAGPIVVLVTRVNQHPPLRVASEA